MQTINDTQQRILDSAKTLIHSRSYADVGVAAICEHAGVKKGSFYHFYPSKQELTLAVIENFFLEFKEKMLVKAFIEDIPPLARLDRMAQLAFEFQHYMYLNTGHVLGCPFGNLTSELATQDETIRIHIEQVFTHLKNGFQKVLSEAISNGDVKNIDIEATAQAMLAYFEGVMLLAKSQNNSAVISQLLPAISQIRIAQK
ncbi:MAG: TetR/AcrR family transcriptional regulator [Gallionellaceae bacterium]|jgi:TetR/AcrR family transcriptional repressor of nem operon